jgi:hypothetical protein
MVGPILQIFKASRPNDHTEFSYSCRNMGLPRFFHGQTCDEFWINTWFWNMRCPKIWQPGYHFPIDHFNHLDNGGVSAGPPLGPSCWRKHPGQGAPSFNRSTRLKCSKPPTSYSWNLSMIRRVRWKKSCTSLYRWFYHVSDLSYYL